MKKLLLVFSLLFFSSIAKAQEQNIEEEVDYYPFDNWKPGVWDPAKQMKDIQENVNGFIKQMQDSKFDLIDTEGSSSLNQEE